MMGGECDGVVHHLSRCEVPGLLFICVGFSVREFVAVPLYFFRSHLHCGMSATGRELAITPAKLSIWTTIAKAAD